MMLPKPVESTFVDGYVDTYVPIPQLASQSINHYTESQLQADQMAQDTQDIIARGMSEAGSTVRPQDRHLLQQITASTNEALEGIAGENSTARARAARQLARQVGMQLSPLQQRHQGYMQMVDAINQMGYAPEYRERAMEELNSQFHDITMDDIQNSTYMPDTTGLSFASYHDIDHDLMSLAQAMRPDSDPATLSQYNIPGYMVEELRQRFSTERLEEIVRHRLGNDSKSASWLNQRARWAAQESGRTVEEEREAMIQQYVANVANIYGRETVQRGFSAPRSGSTNSNSGIPRDPSVQTGNLQQYRYSLSPEQAVAELGGEEVLMDRWRAENNIDEIPVPEGMPEDILRQIHDNPRLFLRESRTASAVSGPFVADGTMRPRDKVRSPEQQEWEKYAEKIKDAGYHRWRNALIQPLTRGELVGEYSNFQLPAGSQEGHVRTEIQEDFNRARSAGAFDQWEILEHSDGGMTNPVRKAQDLAGLGKILSYNFTTPSSVNGVSYMDVVVEDGDKPPRRLWFTARGGNGMRRQGQLMLDAFDPGSDGYYTGFLMTMEGSDGSGPTGEGPNGIYSGMARTRPGGQPYEIPRGLGVFEGYTIQRDENGTLSFRNPQGQVVEGFDRNGQRIQYEGLAVQDLASNLGRMLHRHRHPQLYAQ
jgi:hypothetical protein